MATNLFQIFLWYTQQSITLTKPSYLRIYDVHELKFEQLNYQLCPIKLILQELNNQKFFLTDTYILYQDAMFAFLEMKIEENGEIYLQVWASHTRKIEKIPVEVDNGKLNYDEMPKNPQWDPQSPTRDNKELINFFLSCFQIFYLKDNNKMTILDARKTQRDNIIKVKKSKILQRNKRILILVLVLGVIGIIPILIVKKQKGKHNVNNKLKSSKVIDTNIIS